MKILKPIIISLFAYLFVSFIVVLSVNYYVSIKYDKDAKLWEKYEKGREEYREKINANKRGLDKSFISDEDELKYKRIFKGEYGKDVYWYQYIEDNYPHRTQRKSLILGIYKYAVTPAWLLLTILILIVRSGWFTTYRIKATIVSLTILWVILTAYLSALFGNEMHMTNALVRIVVPIAIAVGLIYLVDLRNK